MTTRDSGRRWTRCATATSWNGSGLAARHPGGAGEFGRTAAAGLLARPELVLHLAAQPFVGRSYREPEATFATNCTGTIHVLEALRGLPGQVAAVFITSDKVYRNDGAGRAFREEDALG